MSLEHMMVNNHVYLADAALGSNRTFHAVSEIKFVYRKFR